MLRKKGQDLSDNVSGMNKHIYTMPFYTKNDVVVLKLFVNCLTLVPK